MTRSEAVRRVGRRATGLAWGSAAVRRLARGYGRHCDRADELFVVLRGAMRGEVGDKPLEARVGEAFVVPAGVGHAWKPSDADVLIVEGSVALVGRLARERRSVRHFSERAVSDEDLLYLVECAAAAPSGADRRPWLYVRVEDAAVRSVVRAECEKRERRYYEEKADTPEVKLFRKMGLGVEKPFLEESPALLVGFGDATAPYWKESFWLSVGYLLLAAEERGMATLTYTPRSMGFLNGVLSVPARYRPQVIVPVGYARERAERPGPAAEAALKVV